MNVWASFMYLYVSHTLALDFSQSDLRRVMLKAFEVPALPTLVWINPKTGEINKEGRTSVMYGEAYFPYTPALLAAGKAEADKKKHEEEEAARQLVLELEAGWKADLQVHQYTLVENSESREQKYCIICIMMFVLYIKLLLTCL